MPQREYVTRGLGLKPNTATKGMFSVSKSDVSSWLVALLASDSFHPLCSRMKEWMSHGIIDCLGTKKYMICDSESIRKLALLPRLLLDINGLFYSWVVEDIQFI